MIPAEKQFADLPSCQQHFETMFCSKLMGVGGGRWQPTPTLPLVMGESKRLSKGQKQLCSRAFSFGIKML
jgi:hypothetical protein